MHVGLEWHYDAKTSSESLAIKPIGSFSKEKITRIEALRNIAVRATADTSAPQWPKQSQRLEKPILDRATGLQSGVYRQRVLWPALEDDKTSAVRLTFVCTPVRSGVAVLCVQRWSIESIFVSIIQLLSL